MNFSMGPYVVTNKIAGLTLCIFAFFMCVPLFIGGLPLGGDPGYQYISYEAFKTVFLDGYVAPRWLHDVNNGMGGANFFFIPPLVYYIALLFDAITLFSFSGDFAIILSIVALLYLSGVSFYYYSVHIAQKKTALIFALVYMCLPYHFWFEIFERTSTTSFAAYIWAPLMLLLFHNKNIFRLKYQLIFCFSYFALILSHIPSAFILSLCIGVYSSLNIFFLYNKTEYLKSFFITAITALTSIGLSAFYLFPAITLLGDVNTAYLTSEDYIYSDWFITPIPPAGCVQPYAPKFLFLTSVVTILVASIHYFFSKNKAASSKSRQVDITFFMSIVSFALMTWISTPFWEYMPFMDVLQFPWRFSFPLEIFSITMLVYIYSSHSFKNHRYYDDIVYASRITFSILIIYCAFSVYMTGNPISKDNIDRYMATKRLTHEHIPYNENMIYNLNDITLTDTILPAALPDNDHAVINRIDFKSRHITLDITSPSPTFVQIRQFLTPWHVVYDVNGNDVSEKVNLRGGSPLGQISINVPSGNNVYHIKMPLNKQEKIGIAISIISLFALMALIVVQRRKQ